MRLAILSFAVGVWLLQSQDALPGAAWPESSSWTLGLGAFAVGLFLANKFLALSQLVIRRAIVLCVAGVAGFVWAALFAQYRLSDSLPVEWESKDIEVIGVVASMPTFGEHGVRFRFDVEKILTPQAVVPRHLSLSWYFKRDGVRQTPIHPASVGAGVSA